MFARLFAKIQGTKIKNHLVVIMLSLAIIPLVLTIAQNYIFLRGALRETAATHLGNIASSQEILLDKWFMDQREEIRFFADEVAAIHLEPDKVLEVLTDASHHNPEYRALFYFNSKGDSVVSTANKKTNVADRQYFKTAMAGKLAISDIMITRTFDAPAVVFAAPVNVNGTIVGVVSASVPADRLRNIIGAGLIDKTVDCYIASTSGYYVVPPRAFPANKLNKVMDFDAQHLSKKDVSVVRYKDFRGQWVLGAHRWIPAASAFLVVKQDDVEAERLAGIEGLTNTVLIAVLLAVILIPTVFSIARRISGPLEDVRNTVTRIANGNFNQHLTLGPVNFEIAELADNINIMADKLRDFQSTVQNQLDELEAQREELASQNEDLTDAHNRLVIINENLEMLAITDQLTELHNRRFFMEMVNKGVEVCRRSGQDLALLMLDLDRFKDVNDTYGHQVGDQVLKEFASLLKTTTRKMDLVARMGGEEFVILAPETDLQGAIILADKVLTTVAGHFFRTARGILNITVSIGLTTMKTCGKPKDQDVVEQMLKVADDNLYAAKANGRNQVVN